jgi:hypothetical protein
MQYLAYFTIPEPKIIEGTMAENGRWFNYDAENNAKGMIIADKLQEKPNALFNSLAEAAEHLTKHKTQWMEEHKIEIEREKLLKIISNKKLPDGIYNPENVPFTIFRDEPHILVRDNVNRQQIKLLIEKHPNGVFANGYQTSTLFFFTEPIKKAYITQLGDGFNYGSTNLLLNCPKNLLILAADD